MNLVRWRSRATTNCKHKQAAYRFCCRQWRWLDEMPSFFGHFIPHCGYGRGQGLHETLQPVHVTLCRVTGRGGGSRRTRGNGGGWTLRSEARGVAAALGTVAPRSERRGDFRPRRWETVADIIAFHHLSNDWFLRARWSVFEFFVLFLVFSFVHVHVELFVLIVVLEVMVEKLSFSCQSENVRHGASLVWRFVVAVRLALGIRKLLFDWMNQLGQKNVRFRIWALPFLADLVLFWRSLWFSCWWLVYPWTFCNLLTYDLSTYLVLSVFSLVIWLRGTFLSLRRIIIEGAIFRTFRVW